MTPMAAGAGMPAQNGVVTVGNETIPLHQDSLLGEFTKPGESQDSKSDSLLSRAREGIRLLFWRGSYRPKNKHNRVGSVDLELGKPLGSEKETQEDYALDDIDKVRELPRTTEMIGSLENDRPCLARGLKDLTRSFSTRRPSHEYLSLY